MRQLFYLLWIVTVMFGIYLRKKKNVVVPFWVKMISVILYLIAFYAYISFIA
ncbi:hypothetical protein O3793_04460 [Granulicatella sp. 20925_1_28]|uniref:hypothetical protein n=1 Tax=Granulicatella sp. 20925_1_28 TaxID=3003686 RepID=UPI00352F6539